VTNGVAIVLQARMGSSRLPGKSLAPIEGRTILGHCIERLRSRSGLPVIVATTTLAEDDVLAAEASRWGAPTVRGSASDVLSRFVLAANMFDLRTIIRATADNPAVDMDAPRRTLDLIERTGANYVVEHGLPYGCAVEAVSVASLREAAAEATEAYDREHVTPFLKRERRFRALDAIAPSTVRRADLRLTVDTPEDLDFLRWIYAFADEGAGPAPLASLIAAADHLASDCEAEARIK
jgi:spore coat polysaccharide biosynthesis protein SpsF